VKHSSGVATPGFRETSFEALPAINIWSVRERKSKLKEGWLQTSNGAACHIHWRKARRVSNPPWGQQSSWVSAASRRFSQPT